MLMHPSHEFVLEHRTVDRAHTMCHTEGQPTLFSIACDVIEQLAPPLMSTSRDILLGIPPEAAMDTVAVQLGTLPVGQLVQVVPDVMMEQTATAPRYFLKEMGGNWLRLTSTADPDAGESVPAFMVAAESAGFIPTSLHAGFIRVLGDASSGREMARLVEVAEQLARAEAVAASDPSETHRLTAYRTARETLNTLMGRRGLSIVGALMDSDSGLIEDAVAAVESTLNLLPAGAFIRGVMDDPALGHSTVFYMRTGDGEWSELSARAEASDPVATADVVSRCAWRRDRIDILHVR